MIIAAVVTTFLCWAVGGTLIYKALSKEPPEAFEPLAPEPDSITLNQDLGSLV